MEDRVSDRVRAVLDRQILQGGPTLRAVVQKLRASGGRPIIVGGVVRDLILGEESADIDIEVLGMSPVDMELTLQTMIPLVLVGKAFAVYKIRGAEIEFSLPRRDSLIGRGHRDFAVEADPGMSFTEAARRRDFTMNAMGLDPLTMELLDPWQGRRHLREGMLEVVDGERFGDDPLRVLRAAAFLSRFVLVPSLTLIDCSRRSDALALPTERIFSELTKMLLGRMPSLGLRFLLISGWIRFLPEVAAMVGVPQDETWHPEGDVWEHALASLDAAVPLCTGDPREDLLLMLGALCHDLGKAVTTRRMNGRIRSLGHSEAGAALASRFLTRLTKDRSIIAGVQKLVRCHLAPEFLHSQGASASAVRRLARRLAPEVDIQLLERCSRADYRASGVRCSAAFPAGEWLLETARNAGVLHKPEAPVLLGRHLIDAGMAPGPHMGMALRKAYEIQIEEGVRDVTTLKERVLSGSASGGSDLEPEYDPSGRER